MNHTLSEPKRPKKLSLTSYTWREFPLLFRRALMQASRQLSPTKTENLAEQQVKLFAIVDFDMFSRRGQHDTMRHKHL